MLSYGITGSGKTYTMMGPKQERNVEGIIPRAARQIFQSDNNWTYQNDVFSTKLIRIIELIDFNLSH